MTTSTSGHIDTNGGIRGHSAGEVFPWRVMGQGNNDSLKWWVISPQGHKVGIGFDTTAAAYRSARALKRMA